MNPYAVYPGSFDPITNGHLEIIRKAAKIFDEDYVLVSVNPNKHPAFTAEERVKMIKDVCEEEEFWNVKVFSHDGLIIDFFKTHECDVIIKGLRAVTDFEAEFQMAHINKNLCSKAETMFLCADSDTTYLSSSMVKQIAQFGGDIRSYVPECIRNFVEKRLSNNEED